MLVLCHGNVGRSPLAGAVLSRALGSERVRTAACKNYGGLSGPPKTFPPAQKKVREYASLHGYDLSQHRACNVSQETLDWADLILYMDGRNRKLMQNFMNTKNWGKAKCLASYAGAEEIPDPGFIPRGVELETILDLVVEAALGCVKELLGQRKTPV